MSVQNAIEIKGDPTALYRLFSADGTLLYVGITRNIPERFARHEAYKRWWPLVARKTMTWYGSREAAITAEAAAITAEGPVYNVVGVSTIDEPIPKTGRRRNWSVSTREAEAVLSGLVKSGEYQPTRRRKTRTPSPLSSGTPSPPAAAAPVFAAAAPRPRGPARRPVRATPLRPEPRRSKCPKGKIANKWIAEQLEAKIRSGEFAPGVQLPKVSTLEAEYGVCRDTILRAFVILRRCGLLTRRRDGYFVMASEEQKPLAS